MYLLVRWSFLQSLLLQLIVYQDAGDRTEKTGQESYEEGPTHTPSLIGPRGGKNIEDLSKFRKNKDHACELAHP